MTLNITTIMRIKNIFMATLLGVMLHSCEFLDVVPDDTSTLDDAFKTETNAGNFIYGCYSVMPAFLDFRNNEAWATTPEMIGSPHWTSEWFYYLIVQRCNYSPAYGGSALWKNMYDGIRNCWIFLNLAADICHIYSQNPIVRICMRSPDIFDDRLICNNLSCILCKKGYQFIFNLCKTDFFFSKKDSSLIKINL